MLWRIVDFKSGFREGSAVMEFRDLGLCVCKTVRGANSYGCQRLTETKVVVRKI